MLQGVCHRDLKLENTLLDGRTAPRLKICDFGYSKVVSLSPTCLHEITQLLDLFVGLWGGAARHLHTPQALPHCLS